ncbi:MAG: uroporphyrinogen decarboxylase [Parachlamydiaceae bacterium]|nr:uroporphyrinogen decarboxylase [Parachlamydiaceae bacterium]
MHDVSSSLMMQALRCSNVERPPIWIMRQAGRYMPEYRAIREKRSFLEMCHTPELAAEITCLPIKAFGFDAAILFSDILVIAEAMGVGLRFEEGKGPVIERPLSSAADVDALPQPHIADCLSYVAAAIKCVKPQLNVPLLGFCGAPFTVASYMIEGGSSRDLKKTKQWMLRDPDSFHRLLDKIAISTLEYLKMQIAAGVNAVQIFDSWANVLGHTQFREFSLAYLQRLLEGIKGTGVPAILFCRGSSVYAQQLADIAPAAISLDWQVDMTQLRSVVPSTVALQGNLDPDILYADHATIRREVMRLVHGMRKDRGYIFNLGHGIHPDTPVDAVKALVACIKEG